MSSNQIQLTSNQLDACARDFRHSMEEVRNLLTYANEQAVSMRPSPSSWSALQCVAHLNRATEAMLPGIRQAVEAAPPCSGATRSLKMDLPGRLLAWSLEPPALIKLKAPKLAEPLEAAGPEPVLQEFDQQHNELIQLLDASAGKSIDQQKMKSPFANMHYSAYSAFRIIAAHDRRHLWQARKALERKGSN